MYVDSIARAPRGGLSCWESGSEYSLPFSDIEVLRVSMLSWRFGAHRYDDVVMDLAYAGAVVRSRLSGDEWLLLMNIMSLHEASASRRSWTVINKPFGPAIDCVALPTQAGDLGRVPDAWSEFEGEPDNSSTGVNRDAWLEYLGISPPFNSEDYQEFDPEFSHP